MRARGGLVGRDSLTSIGALLVAGTVAAACAPSDDGAASSGDAAVASVCYRAQGSALGRLPNDAGGAAVGPGWIRVDGGGADSGAALLVDADGASLGARWRRADPDSIHLVGFDDFIRVEMRLAQGDTTLRGRIRTTSDASLERDSTGQLRSLDRTSEMVARAAACDSMPPRRNAAAPRAGREGTALTARGV